MLLALAKYSFLGGVFVASQWVGFLYVYFFWLPELLHSKTLSLA